MMSIIISMTTKLVDRALKYNANTRYLQPAIALSDNIISHAITPHAWRKVFDYLNSRLKIKSVRPTLVTTYHDSVQVLTVSTHMIAGKIHTEKQLDVVFQVDRIPCESDNSNYGDGLPDPSQEMSWEFMAENVFELSLSRFPLSYDYDHTRQALQWTFESEMGFKVVMELLIEGLRSYDDLKVAGILDNKSLETHEQVFSRSFRIYLDDKSKANRRNLLEILTDHLDHLTHFII